MEGFDEASQSKSMAHLVPKHGNDESTATISERLHPSVGRRDACEEPFVTWSSHSGRTLTRGMEFGHEEERRRSGLIRRAGDGSPAPLCVELIALTAVRPGEARGGRWDEIDVDAGTWTIAAPRMKAGREFTVPLGTGAPDVLERACKLADGSPLVFPSRTGRMLAPKTVSSVLRLAGVDSTLHGFRSSARSWMAESGVPAEVAEACLAHIPKSRVVQAYQRFDLLERRAGVLQA